MKENEVSTENTDRFADPIHCSPADGRLVPIDPRRSPAAVLEALEEALEIAEDAVCYVSEYFRDKHQYDAQIYAIRKRFKIGE